MNLAVEKDALAAALTQSNNALLIGNGINLFDSPDLSVSSESFMQMLAKQRNIAIPKPVFESLSFAEIGDILWSSGTPEHDLQGDVKALISENHPAWTSIGVFAQANNLPILTTNYNIRLSIGLDEKPQPRRSLQQEAKAQTRLHIPKGWAAFRGPKPRSIFARNNARLWHVHGSVDLKPFIKITSAHYSKAFAQAYELIHHGGHYANENCDLLSCLGCEACHWAGKSTWLDIFFHRNLVIIGYAFSESETFLRALLIERFKYLKHRDQAHNSKSFFVTSKEDKLSEGQKYFLESFGLEIITVNSKDGIYRHPVLTSAVTEGVNPQ